jgi:hypothetical protein
MGHQARNGSRRLGQAHAGPVATNEQRQLSAGPRNADGERRRATDQQDD